MTDRRKNLLVGAAVLLGLVLLGWMILQFGGVAILPFTTGRAHVSILTTRADGVGRGSPVLYRGMSVGSVQEIRLGDDMVSVVIGIELNRNARVPANVDAVIRPQSLMAGNAAIFLELNDGAPTGKLGSGAELRGRVGTLELMPPEFAELASELRKTTQQFRESGLVQHLDQAVVNISSQATKAGKVMESMEKIVGDEETRKNIQQSLASLNEVAGTAKSIAGKLDKFSSSLERTGGNVEKLTSEAADTAREARVAVKSAQGSIDSISRQISDRLTQTAGLLESLSSVSRKIDQGKGSAGMMVNDPKLYEAMVESAKQLNATLSDLKRLVEQWEEEGVSFKLH